MSKVTAPLLSFGASGKIANTQVYSSWRGIPYVRRHVIPTYSSTTPQQLTREVFLWASNIWKQSTTVFRAAWAAAAKGQPKTDRNMFIGANTKSLRAGSDLSTMVWSPGNGGALPPSAASASGSSGTITGSTTNPTAPTGYTLAGSVMLATLAGDPHSLTAYLSAGNEDTSTKDAPTITGLAAGDYVCGLFLHWTKADGSDAYSTALYKTATVS